MSEDHDSASLATRQSMGGIIGEKGYSAQALYVCLKLPYWLLDEGLEQVLVEGSSDVDVLYRRGERIERHYLQIKDHPVTPAELREVIRQFESKDAADPGTFFRFELVAKGFSSDILTLRNLLKRLRGAAPMYSGTKTEADTLTDLREAMNGLGLQVEPAWLLNKVYLEDSAHIRTWPEHRHGALNEFAGALADLPEYGKTLKPALARAFDPLRSHVADNTAQVLHRADLLRVIQKTVFDFQDEVGQSGLAVFVDHWGDPTYQASLEHDVLVDWRTHFDRETRRVPPPEVWDSEIVPELQEIERRLRAVQVARQVNIRGGGTLSMGVVLGQTFSGVKGYEVTVQQGPELWRSSATAAEESIMTAGSGVVMEDPLGDGLCLEINAARIVGSKVRDYQLAQGVIFQGRLVLDLLDEQMRLNAATAVKAVQEIRHHLGRALDRHGFCRVHLFYAGPFGLAVLLGHLLNSVGEVRLYELQLEGGYARCATLQTA